MNENTTEPTYIILELQAPIVVTLSDSSVFKAKKYRITEHFIHCSGRWVGSEEGETTLMIPMTSVICIDFKSRQVPEEEVPESHKASVKFQVDKLKPTSSNQTARG